MRIDNRVSWVRIRRRKSQERSNELQSARHQSEEYLSVSYAFNEREQWSHQVRRHYSLVQ